MINLDYKNIYKIIFWKRSQNSIEEVVDYELTFNNDKWDFKYNGSDTSIDTDTINNLVTSIKDLDIDNISDEYKAYYYENDKNNYLLKFLLFVEDKNHIYLGVKGLYPFKQEKYQEIVDLFKQIKK